MPSTKKNKNRKKNANRKKNNNNVTNTNNLTTTNPKDDDDNRDTRMMMMEDDVDAMIDHSKYPALDGNELYKKWKLNRQILPTDFNRLLDPTMNEQRRGDLFEKEDEVAMESYAWAIPDDRALRICAHFAPLVEMGAGAGYWTRLLREQYNVPITAYDKNVLEEEVQDGCTTTTNNCQAAGVSAKPFTKIEKGGPEMLSLYPNATLLLIYPDDYEDSANTTSEEDEEPKKQSASIHPDDDDDDDGGVNSKDQLTLSMAALQNFHGDTIIHVGEWLGSTLTLSMEGQETPDNVYPWGRSTSPDFQIVMEASFHRILQVPLPNWGSVRNCLTVWKRTTSVVLEGDRYAYIPEEEQLEMTLSSPSTTHLLE